MCSILGCTLCICLCVWSSNAGPGQPACGAQYNGVWRLCVCGLVMRVQGSLCVVLNTMVCDVCVCGLVMRVQGSLRVVLNTMVWPNMLVERSSKRSVRISAIDADDGIKIYLIQVSESQSLHLSVWMCIYLIQVSRNSLHLLGPLWQFCANLFIFSLFLSIVCS